MHKEECLEFKFVRTYRRFFHNNHSPFEMSKNDVGVNFIILKNKIAIMEKNFKSICNNCYHLNTDLNFKIQNLKGDDSTKNILIKRFDFWN